MSNHPKDISREEEQAAQLTAFVLGELDESERLQVELQLDGSQRDECEQLERIVRAITAGDRRESLPDSSAALRDAVRSRLGSYGPKVELIQTDHRGGSRERMWFVWSTGLSLLLVAIAISTFLSRDLSHSMPLKFQLAELRETNARLRAEADTADDHLAMEQAARRIAQSELNGRQENLSQQLAQQYHAAIGNQPASLATTDGANDPKVSSDSTALAISPNFTPDKSQAEVALPYALVPGANATEYGVVVDSKQGVVDSRGVNPSRVTRWSVSENSQPYYVTPNSSQFVTEAQLARGGWAYKPQSGMPPPNQLAAGPNARGAGTAIINYGRSVRGQPTKQLVQSYRQRSMGATTAELKKSPTGQMPTADKPAGNYYGHHFMFDFDFEQVAKSSDSLSLGESVVGRAREQYAEIIENRFLSVSDEPLSTFSIDVDTASYANARRFLSQSQMPPADAIRIEEFVNYFAYDYPQPTEDKPFSVDIEVAECPWQTEHQLVRIGLKGKDVPQKERPASNIVFLLDVSGSMQDANKLPLLKQAMKLLTSQLTENDRVSIVTYAGNAGLALDATNGQNEQTIRDAIDALNANGSTNGSAGIQLAYDKATESFIKDGANRVILATDGDLNVGVTSDDALVELIKEKAASGVFLTVLGFGEGNLKDGKLEKLADNGNGMYAYIDSLREARKVLVEQIAGSLVTIAKDVKIKVEFNPAEVASYRLLGYENRLMSAPEFDDDAKDAGEIGAGHTVTALYEVVPTNIPKRQAATTTSLKYQQVATPEESPSELTAAAATGELLTVFLRYKQPDADESTLAEFTVDSKQRAFDDVSEDFRFAAAVASFGMLLRDSEYRGEASYSQIEEIASTAIGSDPQGHRTEFLDLVRKAGTLQLP